MNYLQQMPSYGSDDARLRRQIYNNLEDIVDYDSQFGSALVGGDFSDDDYGYGGVLLGDGASAYSRFAGVRMRKGYDMKQAAKMWANKKAGKKSPYNQGVGAPKRKPSKRKVVKRKVVKRKPVKRKALKSKYASSGSKRKPMKRGPNTKYLRCISEMIKALNLMPPRERSQARKIIAANQLFKKGRCASKRISKYEFE